MCLEIFNNPMVFATILGTFIAWVLAFVTEHYRFNKKKKNEYKLPGGGIDYGETPNEAFIREALEETGCKI